MSNQIHQTADVSSTAKFGEGTTVWHQAQIREAVEVGRNCTISKGVYLDHAVHIGNNVKIQNYVSVYQGVTIEDGVLVGPHACFTNDLRPRAVNADGTLKNSTDWKVTETIVHANASIGANATIVCGVTIGRWAMIGAGAVVTKDVPAHGLVYGNPAQLHDFVCYCGEILIVDNKSNKNAPHDEKDRVLMLCPRCKSQIWIPRADHSHLVERRTVEYS
jgi:acetyltransferase-like isoleucine patch superfamily enzyme